MINEDRLLNEANSLFLQKDLKKLYFYIHSYHQIFQIIKNILFMHFFVILLVKMYQKALSLYDYFTVIKDDSLDEAIRYVEDIVNAYDGDIDKMMEILKDLSTSTVESLDAIRYEDFKKINRS